MVIVDQVLDDRNDPEVPKVLAVLLPNRKASLFGSKYSDQQLLSYAIWSLSCNRLLGLLRIGEVEYDACTYWRRFGSFF